MTSDQDLNDYLNDLLDAARQRSSVSDIERYKRLAECVQEIYKVLQKYKMATTDEIVSILVSVATIPIQMIEPDPKERESMLKLLAIKFTEKIISTWSRDQEIAGTETGKELDKLRNMISNSDMLEK
jgi:hypothetical protein